MLYRATQDGRVMMGSSDKTWSTGEGTGKPLQHSCLENPMNSMKRKLRACQRRESQDTQGAGLSWTETQASWLPPGQCSPPTSSWGPAAVLRSVNGLGGDNLSQSPFLRAQARELSSLSAEGKPEWQVSSGKSSWDQRYLGKHQTIICSGQQSSFFQVISVQRSQGCGEKGARWLKHISFKESNTKGQRKEHSPRLILGSGEVPGWVLPPVVCTHPRPSQPPHAQPSLQQDTLSSFWDEFWCFLPLLHFADVHLLRASIIINKWCLDWLEDWLSFQQQPWPLISEILLLTSISQISCCTGTLVERVLTLRMHEH